MKDAADVVRRAGEFADAEQPDEAIELCDQVLRVEPDHPGALYVMGCVLLKAQRHVVAVQLAKRITELCPRDARGWGLLALIYGELHQYEDSTRNADKALSLRRSDKTLADAAYAHCNAGNWDVAERLSAEALELARTDPSEQADAAIRDASVARGYTMLAKRHWVEGWQGYRATLRTKWRKEWTYGDSREWQGEPDATVMVTGEQGLGDEIMAASVVPDASKACAKFVLDCDARLAPLFARSFPKALVIPGRRNQAVTLPATHAPTHHKSLFGLGELFRTKDADFPRCAYLLPKQDYVDMFRELFGGQRVIGIAWSGGLPRTGMEHRYAGLRAFEPLLRARGAEFVSLQYKDDYAECTALQLDTGLRVTRLPWCTQGQDMDLLAGLVTACSEVITVGTAVAHMASALGVPTTIMCNRGLGWAFAGPDMPWYPPTTTLWRKGATEPWVDCVARLVESRKVKRLAA